MDDRIFKKQKEPVHITMIGVFSFFGGEFTDQQLTIINVTKRHAGIFQCFVSNSLSKVDGGAATLEVVPRSKVASSVSSSSSSSSLTAFSDEEEDDDLDSDSFFDPMIGTSPPTKPAQDAEKKGKGKGGKNRPRGMTFL